MKTAIIHLSLVPVRKEPSDASEMVNQLLFGEGIQLIEQGEKWCKIKSLWDNYSGWVDPKQFTKVPAELLENPETNSFASDLVNLAELENGNALSLVLGSPLPGIKKSALAFGDKNFTYHGEHKKGEISRTFLQEQALAYLNSPYLWGGRSPFGIDCSGFTQMVYKMAGFRLKRDASQQAKQGRTLSFIEEAQVGDLAFFDNPEGRITHVGIMLEDNHIIHASGCVRIDKLDHQGIFNPETGQHTHKLRLITTLLD